MTRNMVFGMLKGLAKRMVEIFIIHVNSQEQYRSENIQAEMRDVLTNAMLIGASFVAFMFLLVVFLKLGAMNLVAGLFLALGLGQQISSVCIDVVTSDLRTFIARWNTIIHILAEHRNWPEIKKKTDEMFTDPAVIYSWAVERELEKIDIDDFIKKRSAELEYYQEFNEENFSEHAILYLRRKLRMHKRLYDSQQRMSSTYSIVFLAIGTLIWFLT